MILLTNIISVPLLLIQIIRRFVAPKLCIIFNLLLVTLFFSSISHSMELKSEIHEQEFPVELRKINDYNEEIEKKSYLINLMRINAQLDKESTYIFPEMEADGYFRVIRGWAKNNPKSKNLYVWYDSTSVTESQIEKTKRRINDESSPEYISDLNFVKNFDAKRNPEFDVELLNVNSKCNITLRASFIAGS